MNEQLLPRDKQDFESVEALKLLYPVQIEPLIPQLLTWLQDGNWPIANEITNILLPCGYSLIPHIKAVLNSDDGQWKYFLLKGLLKELPKDVLLEVTPELLRLAMNPTDKDMEEEVDELAEEILSGIL